MNNRSDSVFIIDREKPLRVLMHQKSGPKIFILYTTLMNLRNIRNGPKRVFMHYKLLSKISGLAY